MAFRDDPHEFRFGIGDVGERLRRLGIGIENDEVDGMARFQRHADFGIFLEAADAGTVAGTWIDDDERPQRIVDDDVLRRQNPHERVADRMFERARVGEDFIFVRQQRGFTRLLVRDPVVPAFAQRIEEQRAALREIGGVMEPVGPQLLRTLDRVYALEKSALRFAHALNVRVRRILDAPIKHGRDVARDVDRAIDGLVEIRHGLLLDNAALQHRTSLT